MILIIIAISIAIVAMVVMMNHRGQMMMSWATTEDLPW